MTLTMGKRGTIVIPKALRDECSLAEGTKIDVSLENNTIVLQPSISTRTRLDESFDEARAILKANGVTLEMAMAKLLELKQESHRLQEAEANERSIAS